MKKIMLVLLCTVAIVAAQLPVRVSVVNVAPAVQSVQTFELYVSSEDNVPSTNITVCNTVSSKRVYVQTTVNDANGYEDVSADGSVQYRIVMINGTDEKPYPRQPGFHQATFEAGAGLNGTYTGWFEITPDDNASTYRVYARVNDSEYGVDGTQRAEFIFGKKSCRTHEQYALRVTNDNTVVTADTLSITLATQQNVTGQILVTSTTSSPVAYTDFGKDAIGFYDITVSKNINSSLSSAQLLLTYDDSAVHSLDENSLKWYTFDGTNWVMIANSSVNTSTNTVTSEITHFSLYAVFGIPVGIKGRGGAYSTPTIVDAPSGSGSEQRTTKRVCNPGTTYCGSLCCQSDETCRNGKCERPAQQMRTTTDHKRQPSPAPQKPEESPKQRLAALFTGLRTVDLPKVTVIELRYASLLLTASGAVGILVWWRKRKRLKKKEKIITALVKTFRRRDYSVYKKIINENTLRICPHCHSSLDEHQ
ncbi:hypothetical protein HY490_03830 [Candidatus Woesearchaeota archaeon]|nr:hypothetical protein [Candidatus Woesearchaeota archaeon]